MPNILSRASRELASAWSYTNCIGFLEKVLSLNNFRPWLIRNAT